MDSPASKKSRYAAAAGAAALAVAARWLLDPILGDQLPLVTLFSAVAFAAWYGGTGPALVTCLVGFALCAVLFIEPRGTIDLAEPVYFIGFFAYLVACAVITAFAAATERGRTRVEASRELLRATLESVGDGVITTDAEARVTSLNPVAQALTGWTLPDALGQPLETVFRIIGEQNRQPAENPARRAIALGSIVGLANHTLLIARDGTERAVDDSAAPIRDADGQLSGVVLVFRDVSERRIAEQKLESSERELLDFFENASIGIHWVVADGTIVRANRAELAMLGYERDEYVGRHIAEFHVDREVIDDILAKLRAGEIIAGREARLRCKDGSIRSVSIDSSVKWDEGRFVHTRCLTRDLSDRIRADEAASRMAAIVASSDDAILSKDLDGVIQTWNRGAELLFGYAPEEIIGRSVLLLIPADRKREEDAILDRIRGGLHVPAYETVRRGKHGNEVEIDLKVSPIIDAAGKVIGASTIARDLGPRKRVEADLRESRGETETRLQELQTIYENIPIGMCLLDRELRFVRVNDRLAEMNGIPAAEHIGKTVGEVVPLIADQLEPQFRHILETGRPIVEIELRGETAAQPGVLRTWLESWFPQRDGAGHVTGVNVVAQEITDRKRAEEALHEADLRKNEFLATLAHELRNPLAPIRNGLSILAQAGADPRIASGTQQIMERQLAHMVRLVDDLFDVSRISRGQIELRRQRVELATILSLALETCRPIADSRSITVTVSRPDAPIYLNADVVRLCQVMANVLGNACKFSEPGSEVRVSGAQVGAEVQLAVEDSGIGIKPELLESVFEMFTQIDRSPERQGLGIGLGLAKRLVELHGGRIVAESAGPGLGSRFVITLPAADESRAAGAADDPTPLTSEARRQRVLVVDDNRDGAESLALWLQLKGHDTHVAHDGCEALIAAENFGPTVVLLDIDLPKLDGYEVCRRIRREGWGQRMKVVALTGWGQEESKRASAAAGFDTHLVKPVDHALLEKVLASPPTG